MKNKFKNKSAGYIFAIAVILLGSGFAFQGSKASNEKVVRGVYTAYEKKDWNMLTSLFAPGFTFTSPVDNHIDLKEYKVRCWPNSANIKKFDIEKLVVDGDDVFVLYNGWNNSGKEFRNTEYFKLKDGKIKEFTCFFGPGISFPNNTKK
jgi:ketosteroid isomerase-like protein